MKQTYIVLGAGFGDEGKGLVTNHLCEINDNPLVVRFSGGHQAGHTVIVDGLKHVFTNFGSGTLQNVPTYWSNYCTFDPVTFMREHKILTAHGKKPKIYIHGLAPVTTPFDKAHNDKSIHQGHGTCGLGVGSTFQRQENFYRLTVVDLVNPFVFNEKYEQIKKYYQDQEIHGIKEGFIEAVEEVKTLIKNSSLIITKNETFLHEYETVIFEGSQGIMLDQHVGIFPHVTRSHTTSKNAMSIIRRNELPVPEVCYVTRSYQTRHGEGPMSNTDKSFDHIELNPLETNVDNKYQGKFRTTMLDLDLLLHAINADGYNHKGAYQRSLYVTCMDQCKNNLLTFTLGKRQVGLDPKMLNVFMDLDRFTIYTCDNPEGQNIKRV